VARQAAVGRVVTGMAGIGRVQAVRLRAVAMTAPKGATATGHAKAKARNGKSRTGVIAPSIALAKASLEKVGWRSSKGSSKCGLSGRVATEPTETDRVLQAVHPGDVGTMTARP
jgi:hypothetical protein